MLLQPMHTFPDCLRSPIPTTLYHRFREREHAEAFLEEGRILIRNLHHHRGVEREADHRVDPIEGMFQMNWSGESRPQLHMEVDGKYIPLGLVTEINRDILSPESYFPCCFSKQRNQVQDQYGGYLVKICDPTELINMMTNGVISQKHFCWGDVRYYDETGESDLSILIDVISGKVPIWMVKRDRFRHEEEFRFLMTRGDVDRLQQMGGGGVNNFATVEEWQKKLNFILVIGDLRKIAVLETE